MWRLARRGRPLAPLPSPWSPPQPPRHSQPPTEPLGELTSRCTRVTAPPSPRSLSDWRQRLSRVGSRLPPPPNGANRSQPRSGPSLGPPQWQILVRPWCRTSWEKDCDWFLIDPSNSTWKQLEIKCKRPISRPITKWQRLTFDNTVFCSFYCTRKNSPQRYIISIFARDAHKSCKAQKKR